MNTHDTQTTWTTKAEREAIARETGLNSRKLRLSLLVTSAQIHRDIAPAIAELREIEDFIGSGHSLVGWLKESRTPVALPAWARLQAPALPANQPMPKDVCLAPLFRVV